MHFHGENVNYKKMMKEANYPNTWGKRFTRIIYYCSTLIQLHIEKIIHFFLVEHKKYNIEQNIPIYIFGYFKIYK